MQNTNGCIRQCSNSLSNQQNGQKLVGSWLLGCSGMVFGAVVLGGVSYYYFVYYTATEVLEKAIDATSRK